MKRIVLLFLVFISSLISLTVSEATIFNFMEIKGIGEKTANRIIEYRDSHELTSIDDLIKVKGIGKKKLERIKTFFESESISNSTSDSSSEIDLTKYDE